MSFYKKYLMLNLNEYSEFRGFNFYISLFVAILALALCVGVFIANSRKNIMVRVVRQIYRHGAFSEEKAKTLRQLNIRNTYFLRKALSDGTLLSKIVLRQGARKLTYEEYITLSKKKKKKVKKTLAQKEEEAHGIEHVAAEENPLFQKVDFNTAKFYIASECDAQAKRIFNKNRTSLFQNILICIFIISLSICLIFLMPEILNIVNSLIA